MMVSVVLSIQMAALVASSQVPQQYAPPQNGGQVISRMLQKYFNAKSVTGTIVQSTTDGGGKPIKLTTRLSYERPSRFLVTQDHEARNGLMLKAVSDGKVFWYDPPNNTPLPVKPGERFWDPVTRVNEVTEAKEVLLVGDMLAIARSSLIPVTSLDLAVNHQPHVQFFVNSATGNYMQAMALYKGKQVFKVTGQWRHKASTGLNGPYEILISQDYDLLRFVVQQIFVIDGKEVRLTVIEESDLKINTKIDEKVFIAK